jgi:hypothetical protein
MQLEEKGTKAERFAKRRWGYEVGGGAIGALAGAGMGAIFGGSAAGVFGAVMGAAMGAGTAWAASNQAQEVAQHDEELDAAIGVERGDLGAPGLIHPRPTIGAFSKEATGAAGAGNEPEQADGPIVPPPS